LDKYVDRTPYQVRSQENPKTDWDKQPGMDSLVQILKVFRADISEEPSMRALKIETWTFENRLTLLPDSICPKWKMTRKFPAEWINVRHTKAISGRLR
jgi:hypothetical protein